MIQGKGTATGFQYSLCRVVLMVILALLGLGENTGVSVLALSSRFDGHRCIRFGIFPMDEFQYSLCRVVLMVLPSAV